MNHVFKSCGTKVAVLMKEVLERMVGLGASPEEECMAKKNTVKHFCAGRPDGTARQGWTGWTR